MRVILAVNDPKHAVLVAQGALDYGISNADEVAIVCVITSPGPPTWSVLPPPLVAEIDAELRFAAENAKRKASLTLQDSLHSQHLHEFTLYGHLHEELKQFVLNWEADLLIIGFHEHKPGTDNMKRIIDSCPCPVLIIGPSIETADAENHRWREPSYII